MNQATVTKQETKAQSVNSPNLFNITGHLGDAPRVVHFDSGNSLTEISIGVNEPGKEKASWYRVVLWNKVGEIAAQYLERGSKVSVKGQFKFDTWTDKNSGEARRSLKLHVNDSFGLDLHQTISQVTQTSTAPVPAPAPKPVSAPKPVAAEPANDEEWDEIPF